MDDTNFSIKKGNVIAYCPIFLQIERDTKFVLFLSQVWYWSSRTKNKDGWFYKTQEDWEKELGLTATEQKRIRDILKKKGILDEKLKGLPRQLHFCLNKSKLSELLRKADENNLETVQNKAPAPAAPQYKGNLNTSIEKTLNQVSKKPLSKSEENLDASVDETTEQVSMKSLSKSEENLDTSIEKTAAPIYTETTSDNTSEITPETTTQITSDNNSFVTQARLEWWEDTAVENVFLHWKSMMNHSSAQLDIRRKALINRALIAGYSEQALCEAISGCAKTPHNLGDNERGQRYDGLHIILRDADQIDRFIANYHCPPQMNSKSKKLVRSNSSAVHDWLNQGEGIDHAEL